MEAKGQTKVAEAKVAYDTKQDRTAVTIEVARVSGGAEARMGCDDGEPAAAEEPGTKEWGFEVCCAQVSR